MHPPPPPRRLPLIGSRNRPSSRSLCPHSPGRTEGPAHHHRSPPPSGCRRLGPRASSALTPALRAGRSASHAGIRTRLLCTWLAVLLCNQIKGCVSHGLNCGFTSKAAGISNVSVEHALRWHLLTGSPSVGCSHCFGAQRDPQRGRTASGRAAPLCPGLFLRFFLSRV